MINFWENINWDEVIAQYRPFCNFLWCFGAKDYYTLDDYISVFQILNNILVTVFQNFMLCCCKI